MEFVKNDFKDTKLFIFRKSIPEYFLAGNPALHKEPLREIIERISLSMISFKG